MKRILLILLALSLGLAETASTKNYYVNAVSGNNSNNGLSSGSAKKTLAWFSWSTTFLQPGDTVFVMNGTYTGSDQFAILALRASGNKNSPLVITNYPGHKPLLKMNEHKWAAIHIAEGVHDVVINGLTIQGYAANLTLEEALVQPGSCANPAGNPLPKFNGSGISIEGRTNGKHVHHITVSNCEIFECAGGGTGSMEADYITFESNIIYNNCWYTLYGNSGISNLNSWNYDDHNEVEYSMIIRNNILFGNQLFVPWVGPCKIYDGNGIIIDCQYNEDRPFDAYSGKTLIENNVVYDNGGRGIHVYKSANVDIINNTCYFNGRSPELDDGEITLQEASDIRVFNNIMYARDGERASLKYKSYDNITFGNNLIYNAASHKIAFTSDNDVKNVSPAFSVSDLDNPDLHLTEDSPARNAGTKEAGLFSSYDIEGVSRFSGGTPDIGAYEYEEEVVTGSLMQQVKPLFLIYPNPAEEYIKVLVPEGLKNRNFNYTLINAEGKSILTGNLSTVSGDVVSDIDVHDVKEGLYYLKAWNNESRYVQKVLIAK